MQPPEPWSNWAGNITYRPARLFEPTTPEEVVDIVAAASTQGRTVRAAGTSHSSTPLSLTGDTIVNLGRMAGITGVDRAAHRVSLLPGTRVNAIGPALWEHGLALKNQGDIDAQQFAGAISTGTHGSGRRLQSFSGSVRGLTAVTGTGEVVTIDDSDHDRLAAAQVGLGLTGIFTSIDLDVRDAFFIHEAIRYWTLDELYERWDEEFERRLHFSFFWYPAHASPGIFNMRVPDDGRDLADTVYVKRYDEVPLDAADDLAAFKELPADRVDRPYRIYPEIPTDVFHELEYMIPFEHGKKAMAELREFLYTRFPDNIHPVEVRCVARDTAYLSPQYERDNIVIAVHCDDLATGEPFLRAVSDLLAPYGARPHWGKLHWFDDDHLEAAFPALDRFRRVRREIDPQGTFLNDYLRPLFT
ncbi:FAD/FMN-containing dehydrogenase [Pseudonocardia hierapolitana]|uniref:FAD/FMN-containing dehydrogenase n=1 Tax=Pseudonocardia hierapolitana TaxID=1128676 RepID=A0A561SJL1_9PSEU|nr:D-arabinono-1,4-lactone oxidase [Pseudonocardia hierapolitana]TWF75014.1 FAD/FMN-containing dehydrogenase [Pseudonocardia hierapolitana]